LRRNSYLKGFIDEFWKKDFKKSQEQEGTDFYINNEKNFVTDYAASNA
jgi:hypothetical protein